VTAIFESNWKRQYITKCTDLQVVGLRLEGNFVVPYSTMAAFSVSQCKDS